MSRLPFASLAFVLFLASNFEVSDSHGLDQLVYKAIGDIGGLNSKVEKLQKLSSKVESLDTQIQELKKISSRVNSLDTQIQNLNRKLSSRSVSCYDKYTGWTGRSDARIMNLDRHNLDCPRPYFLARFQLKRSGWENHSNVRYEYRCCKVVI